MNPATKRKKQVDQARHASKGDNSQGKKIQPLLSVERNSSSPSQKTAVAALKNKVLMSLGQTRSSLQAEVITLLWKKISLTEVKMQQAESHVFTDEWEEFGEEADAESLMSCHCPDTACHGHVSHFFLISW